MSLPKDPIKREEYLHNLRTRSIGKKASQETRDKMSASRKGIPKSESHKKKIAESHIGLKQSEETKRKISESRIGKYCGENHPLYGKHMSEESKQKMIDSNIKTWSNPDLKQIISKSNAGENNHGYIDGRWENYPLYTSIRSCTKMKEWRREVYRRDGYTCQISGTKKNLQPHHIISLSDIIHKHNITTLDEANACGELWDISNGITLNKTIHMNLHYKYGKQIPIELIKPPAQ